jgi:hypothetical protein
MNTNKKDRPKRLQAMMNSTAADLKITGVQRSMIKRQVDCLNAKGVQAMYEIATNRDYYIKPNS